MGKYRLFGTNFNMSITKNFDFESWTVPASPPDDWNLLGSDASVEQETVIKFQGTYSAKVSGGASGGQLYQSVPTYHSYGSRTLTAQCRVNASVGSARIGVADGVTTTWSDWNEDTDSLFKKLRVVHDMVDTGHTELTVILEVASGEEAYFDTAKLISWCFDDGFRFDEDAAKESIVELVLSPYPENFRMAMRAFCDMVLELKLTGLIDFSGFLDLMPLIPEKFHESDVLTQYIYVVSQAIGSWLTKTLDIQYLLDPLKVGDNYIRFLADQIGFTLVVDEETILLEKRRQVLQAIDWYKMKGTYKSLQYVAYLLGMQILVKDMYTNDYSFFELEDWFVGDDGENPEGLDNSYYKSPHFGILVYLNKVFIDSLSNRYLWKEGGFTNLRTYVERTRPANTVPRYIVYMQPETDESGNATEVPEEIYTCVTSSWQTTKKFFDAGKRFGSSEEWNFDDGNYFDQSLEGFIYSTTKWSLGTGNKGNLPDDTGFALENVVLSGDIDSIKMFGNRIEFEFIASSAVLIKGISELGLFNSTGAVLRIASTFPDVDIESGVDFRIKVTVYRT
jgi:hypothetical protein